MLRQDALQRVQRPARQIHVRWADGPFQNSKLARQSSGVPTLDAGLGASLEESLKAFVPEALDHPDDRIVLLYETQWGCHQAPEFQR